MSHSETYESFDKKFANSRTGSSKRVYKRNGEILAVPWYTSNSSYDKPASMRINSTMRASFRDPNMKATLTPYDPNALRNRLPVKFRDEAIPCVRFCKARGEHTYDFMNNPSGKPPGYEVYRTTSQNFYDYDTMMLSVGESNQGIVSEKTRHLHEKQTA